MKLGLIDSIE